MVAAIQKITAEYDANEDRLRLACADEAGAAVVLWLTQRLASRLVRAVVAHLEGEVADPVLQEIVQSWQLSAAQAQGTPETPVHSDATVPQRLVHSVDIGMLPNALRLAFCAPGADPVVLGLENKALRQWLAILHGQYRQADWPCEGIWPAWFDGTGREAAMPAPGVLLH